MAGTDFRRQDAHVLVTVVVQVAPYCTVCESMVMHFSGCNSLSEQLIQLTRMHKSSEHSSRGLLWRNALKELVCIDSGVHKHGCIHSSSYKTPHQRHGTHH